ncbi:DDE-type integrase/transposase/recombinase, partial [Listeria seeligeri]
MTTSLVLDTLQTALDKRQPTQPLLFHTDRGTQYTSSEMRQFSDYHSLTHSYSKKGYPWDNAVTE